MTDVRGQTDAYARPLQSRPIPKSVFITAVNGSAMCRLALHTLLRTPYRMDAQDLQVGSGLMWRRANMAKCLATAWRGSFRLQIRPDGCDSR